MSNLKMSNINPCDKMQTITFIDNTSVIIKRKFLHLNLSKSNYREFTSDRNEKQEYANVQYCLCANRLYGQ